MQGGGMSSVQPQYFRIYYDIVLVITHLHKKRMFVIYLHFFFYCLFKRDNAKYICCTKNCNKCVLHLYNNNNIEEMVHINLHLYCSVKVRTSHCLCEQVWTALPLFVCPSHIGCSICPVWISFNVNLLSLSIRFHLNVRATRAALPCLFLCALPEWTSTGYGNIGSLIWIIRQRRLRYMCSRCI